ncbi:MAG: ribonuclease H-like domain-containing protein [Candidatus Hadarchaeum sp.]|uniref:ribonuclease H-like domain-containing protein n=1 Tax=Candidatus Hadarchaeum sp. TaxID=2883567 RepID=UPI003D0C7EAC
MPALYLDIETSAKNANEGMVIAIGVMSEGEPEVRFSDTFEEERRLLEWLREKLENCDLLVTWFGAGFDVPFLLSRALVHGVDLSKLAEAPMLDLYEWSRAKLLLSSYSLDSVVRFLGLNTGRGFKEVHGGDIPTLFKLAERGDLESRRLIVEHCREDVRVLKLIHDRLRPLVERSGWGSPRKT